MTKLWKYARDVLKHRYKLLSIDYNFLVKLAMTFSKFEIILQSLYFIVNHCIFH